MNKKEITMGVIIGHLENSLEKDDTLVRIETDRRTNVDDLEKVKIVIEIRNPRRLR